MEILYNINDTKNKIKKLKEDKLKIALVPTMGYLHDGHKSLVEKAKKIADIVFISIFINPIQFGPNEDYENYPRDFERDRKIAIDAGVDYIFYPEEKEMYKDFKTYVEVTELSEKLCGKTRPTHFKGVTTVVLKLFNIIQPDFAIFGMKDAQQLRIIEKMKEDLNLDVEIIRGEIIREKDGLAYSSRNKYLNSFERQQAVALRRSFEYAEKIIQNGKKNIDEIKKDIENYIKDNFKIDKIDYISIVNFKNLEEEREITEEVLIAGAIYIGKTRLIDNIFIKIK